MNEEVEWADAGRRGDAGARGAVWALPRAGEVLDKVLGAASIPKHASH